MVDRGDHRIGDSERQQAIDVLRAHTGAGRLTLEEFSDLAGEVYAAQTYGELEAVARNLPPGLVPAADADTGAPGAGPVGGPTMGVPPGPAPTGGTSAGTGLPPGAGGGRHRFVAIMSGSSSRSRWRAASRISAFSFWGGVHIDLRKAEVEGPVVDITAWAIMGGVTVTVAEGTPVELDGMVIMGGSSDISRAAAPLDGAPLVRVHARGLWGGVLVQSKKTPAQRAAASAAQDDTSRAAAGEAPRDAHDARRPPPRGVLESPLAYADDVMARIPDIVSAAGAAAGAPVRRRARRPHRHDDDWRAWSDADDGTAATGAGAPVVGSAATVNGGGPGTPAGGSPSGTLTMMVTDIADSTALAERLGDRRWIEVLGEHNALVREQVARHGGTEVKAQGDGFLVVFPSARRAILAAVDVQRALGRYGTEHPDTTMAVRVGLHTGEIVDVDGDVFGQNVVVAVRIADAADPGEIVVSGLTRDLTVSGGDLTFGPAAEVELKGLSEPWRVHRVTWAPDPA